MQGKRLGKVRLVRKLGAGGMGEVWLGRHETLDKDVAVKMLAAQVAGDAELAERFIREARLSAKLEHPNIAQVYDADREDGVLYLVMQYVEGIDLHKRLAERGAVDVPEALRIAHEAASGLLAAHRHGIAHRDVKPSNVLLGSDGRVYVTDFGLARSMTSGSTLTNPGEVVGTPNFMSPEQAQSKPVDTRTDIYSLGATLYSMLAGRPPFVGSTPVGIMLKHASPTEKPPPLLGLNSEVPPAVAAIVDRMMAKEPANRYASLEDVIRDIEAAQQGSTVTGAKPVRAVAPPRRAWIAVAAAVGVLALVAVALTIDNDVPPAADPFEEYLAGRKTHAEAREALKTDPTELQKLDRTHLVRRTEAFLAHVRDEDRRKASTYIDPAASKDQLQWILLPWGPRLQAPGFQSFEVDPDKIEFEENGRRAAVSIRIFVREGPVNQEMMPWRLGSDGEWYVEVPPGAGTARDVAAVLDDFENDRKPFTDLHREMRMIGDTEALQRMLRARVYRRTLAAVEAAERNDIDALAEFVVTDGEKPKPQAVFAATRVLLDVFKMDVVKREFTEAVVEMDGRSDARVPIRVTYRRSDGTEVETVVTARWVLNREDWYLRPAAQPFPRDD